MIKCTTVFNQPSYLNEYKKHDKECFKGDGARIQTASLHLYSK